MVTGVGVPAVVAAVLLMAGPAWAQRHGGGGHGGGFHGGGFHGGGFHPGNFPHGGFHHGNFHHRGAFFPGYYYGYYPGYYYGSYPSYDLGYDSASDLGYSYGGVAPPYYSGYQALEPPSTGSPDPASAQADSTAHLTLRVPANAELWFEGVKTTSTGSIREFQSPPLSLGRYTYEIRARWTENGRDVAQTQMVVVSPGAHLTVDFPVASGTD
jgi:uncharacterized protein (TIGR03000 family)